MSAATGGELSCAHCGLPVTLRRGQSADESIDLYCCLGCRFAASLVDEDGDAKSTETLTRLGLGVFFAMNVMVFTMALWSQDVYGVSETTASILHSLFRYVALLFTVPVLFLLGGPLFEEAIASLRQWRLSTELLLATGVSAAFGYSLLSVVRDDGHVYFEVICMILVAVTLGRWLEATGKVRTTEALNSLRSLLPETVRVVDDAGETSVALHELREGQEIRIAAGERVAADGKIVAGEASVDRQVVTGESEPVQLLSGDLILAGCLNIDGSLIVRVDARPGATAMDRMIETVVQAANRKEHWGRFADEVTKWFLPTVAVFALVTVVYHAVGGDLGQGLMAGLAVTVVACPCALALAAPLAIWNAFATAARRGIIVRCPEAMSRLARLANLCIDKTGTLTTGEMRLAHVLTASGDEGYLKEVAGQLARQSTHPAAEALAGLATDHSVTCNYRVVPGRGVSGRVAGVDGDVLLGSELWMREKSQCLGAALADRIEECCAGLSMTYLAWGGQVHAAFALEETLRPEVGELLDYVRARAIQLSVLTGDDRRRGERLASALQVSVFSEQLPDDKLAHVNRLKQRGVTAMIGDGINDAPALAAADVGIAMGCGADVARHTADVCLLGNDLRQLIILRKISRDAVRTIRWNLLWALAYNSIAIPIAAMGWLNPIIAALAMALSSLCIVGSSLRLSHHSEPVESAPEADDEQLRVNFDDRLLAAPKGVTA